MALSFSSSITLSAFGLSGNGGGGETSVSVFRCSSSRNRGGITRRRFAANCQPTRESPSSSNATEMKLPDDNSQKLEIGTPVIVTEAPKWLKTAASVPCLIVNSGQVNPGDVGRIVSRKPKDVWAVRLTIGTYLIDGKYFKPLELDQ